MTEMTMIRILLVEDDQSRVDWFRSWLPKEFRLVHAGSGGRALGIIQRDRKAFSGIMLDHDLEHQNVTSEDKLLSGSEVILSVMRQISPRVPVLIHSMNPGRAAAMEKALTASGFSVTRLPMGEMSKEAFCEWLEEVRGCYELLAL